MGSTRLSPELYKRLVAEGRIKELPPRKGLVIPAPRDPKQALAKAIEGALPLVELPLTLHCTWPPSLNNTYWHGKNKNTGESMRGLTEKARLWKRATQALWARGVVRGGALELTLIFRGRFFHADGSMRQVDLSNRIKLLEDTLAGQLGYDDRRHWKLVVEKAQAASEGVIVTLNHYQGALNQPSAMPKCPKRPKHGSGAPNTPAN